MIVPMKKIYIVTQKKTFFSSLSVLRDAGVVHPEPLKTPKGDRIQELKERKQILERVLSALDRKSVV